MQQMMKILRSNSGKLPLLIIVVVLVVVAAAGAFAFLKMGKKPHGKAKEAEKVELQSWTLEEFVVNLRDAETRYLKVNIVLEVEGEAAKGEHEEKSPDEVKARDTIISVLTRKSYRDLQSTSGKDELKSELRTALNSVLETKKVANIYFTSFAML